MALSFPNFNPILWCHAHTNPPPDSAPHPHSNFPVPSTDSFAGLDVETFQSHFNTSFSSSSSKSADSRKSFRDSCDFSRRRRPPRAHRRIQSLDLDFDMVLVPSDSFSGSESEGGSDWSVGWFEPHAPDFCSDSEPEKSFAVLVPCYGAPSPDSLGKERNAEPRFHPCSTSQLWSAVLSNLAKDPYGETNHYLQQWLSSLQP